MKIIVPPIKSQGIKTKLVPWIHSLISEKKGRWIEPFLGTGVVAFNSGFDVALLNDINPHIIKFYQDVKDGKITAEIVRRYLEEQNALLSKAENKGYDHFTLVKNRFNLEFNPLDFLFLSRAGFNGMMRFNKKGGWNIPFCKKPNRFSKSYITKIVNQLRSISLVIRPEWQFYNLPFQQFLKMAEKNDIIYCDPPYIGRYVDYYNGWSDNDELDLFNALSNTKAKFILSTWHHNDYRANLMIEKYWNIFNIVTQDHFYHSGGKIENRRTIVEALVYNFDMEITKHNHSIRKKSVQLKMLSE